MKKFLIALLAFLLIAGTVLAESSDYSSLSFDKLQEIKNAVDREYFSRSESSGFVLPTGTYVVGGQIKPGQYYVAMTEPDVSDYSSLIAVYEDKATFEKEEPYYNKLAKCVVYLFLHEGEKGVLLEEGNVVSISEGTVHFKTTHFTQDELYKYEAPEGTLVPKGIYTVGVDIPEGIYTMFPATAKGGHLSVYALETNKNGETVKKRHSDYGFVSVSVRKEIDSKQLILKKDDIVDVTESVILQKQQKLNFD